MSPVLGQAVLERQQAGYLGDSLLRQERKDYSEQTAREIDLAVRGLLEEAYGRARALLEQRRDDLMQARVCCWPRRPSPRRIPGVATASQ